MRKFLGFIILGILFGLNGIVQAQDLSPSDSYYKDNIAVNEVLAEAPSLKNGDNSDLGPGDGNPESGGGGFVGSPVENPIVPVLILTAVYGTILLLRRKRFNPN